jgi:xanthine dehydrogenase iron-sulfur cluster and FAD-binding subunit A
MLMTALDLIARDPEPGDGEIRHALHGNLCRCTGYQSIVMSIREGAAVMRGEPSRSWAEARAADGAAEVIAAPATPAAPAAPTDAPATR